MDPNNSVIITVCVYLCVIVSSDAALENVSGIGDNLFFKTHVQLYGNRTVCYPLAQSVESLFVATPGWLPHQLYTVDTSGTPCKGQIGHYKRGIQGRCVELAKPTASAEAEPQRAEGQAYIAHVSYSQCFKGYGWGCVYARVPKSNPCVQTQCVQQHCESSKGQFTCVCHKQECLKVTAGRQLMCGMCNGTHISSASWTYPFDQHQQVESNGESGEGGNWNHKIEQPRGTVCYRAKRGYVFLFGGTYTTDTPRLPSLFTVGTIGPRTVPCPSTAKDSD